MIFDRYRNKTKKSEEKTTKKSITSSSLANALFKRFPIQLSRKAKQQQEVELHKPRPSLSLPNINVIPKSEPILAKSASTLPRFQQKRHSADHHPKHIRPIKDSRHSFTFGHLSKSNNHTLTLADLNLEPAHREKLEKLTISIDHDSNTLLSNLGRGPPLTPHRSISHQHLQVQPHAILNRTHSDSHVNILGIPIIANELVLLLQDENSSVTLIDVRHLIEYQKQKIQDSLNVNLPSLLIKRYQRGTVSNFNLENFITTTEGREFYQQQQAKAGKKVWVVYDEEMVEDDQNSQAWTLLKVLERSVEDQGKVFYLSGGFQVFKNHHPNWIETSAGTPVIENNPSNHTTLNTKLNHIPRRSVSYTIGDSKQHRRNTSLFSLDTQAARVNNANALARREKRRSELQQPSDLPQQANLNRVNEDDECSIMTASPRTEAEFSFIISEIIRGFLYVGPEIETKDQAAQLDFRNIKRVLNMAEECQDSGLGSNVIYLKVDARDTVEMKNIESVMMQAVHFIEEAKKNHEPIYVHCKAGKSRSITAILAYLITSEKWTLKQAYKHVITARPTMSPNIGFITELMKMENRVHGRVSSFLQTDWQSSASPNPEYVRELGRLEKAWQDSSLLLSSEK